ncbi:sulfite exporter TauE/SafE family protein [bacterium]|nr:sulfite exporter TauE/SafE family protein [bacterium]
MDQPSPVLSWVLASASVVIIGIAKSGFGSGVGIVAIPLFVFAFGDASQAVGVLLPLLIAADIFSFLHHRGKHDRDNIRTLWPGSLAGIVLGAFIVYWLMGMPRLWWMAGAQETGAAGASLMGEAKSHMRVGIGVVCLLYVAGDQIKARLAPAWRFHTNYVTGTIGGGLAATLSTIAHAGGPPVTIYLLGQQLAKETFVATAVVYFFMVNVIKLVPYALLGLIDTGTLWQGLWLLPLVPVGTWLGVRLMHRMNETVFRTTILVIVLLSGIQLVTGNSLLGALLGK